MNDPLESLGSFYKSLDSIPTPPLFVPKRKGYWALILAPLTAAFLAYGVIVWSAGASSTEPAIRISFPMDGFALRQLQDPNLPQHPAGHASRERIQTWVG
ncbi:MAG TPA: hypothetical protein VGL56_01270 [Fimbriimonadaceae bacterium]|jgi:hypothetical protein